MSFNLLFDVGAFIGYLLAWVHPIFNKKEAKNKGVKLCLWTFIYLLIKIIKIILNLLSLEWS